MHNTLAPFVHSQMNVIQTEIDDVLIIEPSVFNDERGFFFEIYNAKRFKEETGVDVTFVQDNHSLSRKGTLRGMHYQIFNAQDKLVRVSSGSVFDVVVDLRKSSKTFGSWVGVELSAENRKQVFVPKGFAHGFVVLSEQADFLYKVSDFHKPEAERYLRWDCPILDIDWPVDRPALNERDASAPGIDTCETYA